MRYGRPRVFVSYSQRDGLIGEKLLENAYDAMSADAYVYVDKLLGWAPNGQLRVQAALDRADVLVLLMTPAVRHSPWVQYEVAVASERGIPIVRVGHTAPALEIGWGQVWRLDRPSSLYRCRKPATS